nr:unnamed protein product [Digitaria exilis]
MAPPVASRPSPISVHRLCVRILPVYLLLAAVAAPWLVPPCSASFFGFPFPAPATTKRHDYRDALAKSILFFEAQRSGRLPPGQRASWRGDSGVSDGAAAGVDLEGGYYDAGDNVKFGFPMAFTTTMLAWSVLEFGDSMPRDERRHAVAAVRWATDYLLKTLAQPGVIFVQASLAALHAHRHLCCSLFMSPGTGGNAGSLKKKRGCCARTGNVMQVGDPWKDHDCWERPEDMDTERTVYNVSAGRPGSEIAGETAAALAAASMVFREADPEYAETLLAHAREAFEFADTYKGAYSDDPDLRAGGCPFYCDFNGYQEFIEGEVLALQSYKEFADSFICTLIPESSSPHITYTPGGMLYKPGGSNMQHVTSISFLLLTYAKYLSKSSHTVNCGDISVGPVTLQQQAKKQVDYLLGDNPMKMSYMIGYGDRYPQRIHHRASSLPSIKDHPQRIACKEGTPYYNSSGSNPNPLIGAVVGGPGEDDVYEDDRADFRKSEPTTYINAPLVGVLAFLVDNPNPGHIWH